MRTFIAIEIPDDIKKQMAETQRRLNTGDLDASWPRPEGIHLTLKFLGEIPESKVGDITKALELASEGVGRFRLEIAGMGAFPNARSPRVVWVGLTGDLDKLKTLQAAIEDSTVRVGLDREDKPFKPHLTLARIKYIRSRDGWLRSFEQVKDVKLPGFDVTAISLMKSELKRTGAVYTEMARVELKG